MVKSSRYLYADVLMVKSLAVLICCASEQDTLSSLLLLNQLNNEYLVAAPLCGVFGSWL